MLKATLLCQERDRHRVRYRLPALHLENGTTRSPSIIPWRPGRRTLSWAREEFDKTDALLGREMTDEEIAQRWFGERAKIVVIKHGKQGSTAYIQGEGSYSIRPFPVDAVKSTGGGDGYGSAFFKRPVKRLGHHALSGVRQRLRFHAGGQPRLFPGYAEAGGNHGVYPQGKELYGK